jgi:hypothetical protein
MRRVLVASGASCDTSVMCRFVVATLPARVDPARVEARFVAHGLALRPLANASLARQLPPGERCFVTTAGHCDCDTPLGLRARDPAASDDARAVAQLRKQGWSEAKIARWREQARATAERDAREAALEAERSGPGISGWLALLEETLALAPRVGLLMHQYSGALEPEEIAFVHERVPASARTTERLLDLHEDVLYDFER